MNNYSLSIILKDATFTIGSGSKQSVEKQYKSWKTKLKQAWVEVPLHGDRMFLRSSEVLCLHMQKIVDKQVNESTKGPYTDSFLTNAKQTDDVLLTDLGYK